MAQLFRLASAADRSPAQRAFGLRSDVQRPRARPIASDDDLARLTKVNLFLVGSDEVVAKFITSLWPCFSMPVVARHRGGPLRVSPTSAPAGTIVIYDVDTLTCDEQQALSQWMNTANGFVRVVSTAAESLLPMVKAGGFNDALYYRLNVVTIDLRMSAAR